MDDQSNYIPCEICQELINFDSYQNHISRCLLRRGSRDLMNLIQNTENISFNPRLLNINLGSDNSLIDSNDSEESTLSSDNQIGRESNDATQSMVVNIISNILGIPNHDNENLSELFETVGIVEKGIDNINDVSCLVSPNEIIICPICQSEGKKPIRRTLCNHSFCDSCISPWLSKSKKCPSCMQDLEDIFKENN